MGRRPSIENEEPSSSILVEELIGEAYANVRLVAINLDALLLVSGNIDEIIAADANITATILAAVADVNAEFLTTFTGYMNAADASADAAAASATVASGHATTATAQAVISTDQAALAVTARVAAELAETNAEAAVAGTAASAAAAADSATAADASADASAASATTAAGHVTTTTANVATCASHVTTAAGHVATALTYKNAAETAAAAAETARAAAVTAKTAAETAETNAETAQTAAVAAKVAAELAETNAEAAQAAAAASANSADTDANAALASATAAAASEAQAAIYADAIPAGGANGYILTKASAADYDYVWAAPSGGLSAEDVRDTIGLALVAGTGVNIDVSDPSDTFSFSLDPAETVMSVAGLFGAVTGADLKTAMTFVKADVGLGNVDNTSDANKPVSTAGQTALNLKANLAGGNTFTGDQIFNGTQATSATWNAGATVFEHNVTNITDTASAAGSSLQSWKVAGFEHAAIKKVAAGVFQFYTAPQTNAVQYAMGDSSTGLSNGQGGGGQIDFFFSGARPIRAGATRMRLGSTYKIGWCDSPDTSASGEDIAIGRNAAGVMEVNNGTAGQYRDIIVRDVTVADEAYGVSWNGSVKAPTKNAIYDKITALEGLVVGAMVYQGTWNATTNTPAIPAASAANKGYFYKTATAGSTSIDGIAEWAIGDWIVSNGTTWDKIDNTESVVSVAGLNGVISAAGLKTALNLTGTNSGDQTSIVGITGTLAQFNTACTDADLAPLASPALTGTPTAPLAATGTSTTQLATTSFVQQELAAAAIQQMWVPAAAMKPRATLPAGAGTLETTTNKLNFDTLDFDGTVDEFAQFDWLMPKRWNEGTLTAEFVWHAPGGTGNVVWAIQAVALSDDDVLDTAFGTAATVTDAVTAVTDVMRSAATGAMTVAGSPANNDLVKFQIYRDADNGSDTLNAIDARLLGINLILTTNAKDDT